MPRRNKHDPIHHKGRPGKRSAPRRAHGIMTNIEAPSPSVLARVEKRKALYMHSAARRQLEK